MVTLIFNKPKFYRRCILLNKNDEIIVTGQIFNTLNIPKIVHFVQLMLNDLKNEKSKKMKCNYCRKKASVVVKTKFENVKFDMYLCNFHSRLEIRFLNREFYKENK